MTLVNPRHVVLEIARPAKSPSSDEDEIIINQGYPTQEDKIQIKDEFYKVYGMVQVTKDGSIYAGNSTEDKSDRSYKFIQYDIALPNQDRATVEPHAMVLESELLQHHYVHWDVPSLEVRCQQYTAGGGLPPIDVKNSQDQQFVWIIPTDHVNSSQFALKTYCKPYYLEFSPSDLKATLLEGGPSTNKRFRMNQV